MDQIKERLIYIPNDPRFHTKTGVTVVGLKQGEIGYWPIYTTATAEELNGRPMTEAEINAAVTASMWGWHESELTKPILDWLAKDDQ